MSLKKMLNHQTRKGIDKKTKEEIPKEVRGTREALLNILEDVEEVRKEIEEERDKTLSIIENFPEGLLFFDKENRLSSINPRVCYIFGVKPEDLRGKKLNELASVSSLAPLIEILGEEIKMGLKKELELKSGLVLEISSISVMKGEEKAGALVILRDITREKIIERLKTEFVSIAAHQLRTPLSAIKWTLRMILDGDLGKIPKSQEELLKKTYESNERMIHLINDLLNVTRIEEGRFLYNVQKRDMTEILKKLLAPLKRIAKREKLQLEFNAPKEKIPEVSIDTEKISLTMQNLIENAIHYTEPGGKIKVSLSYLEKKKEVLFQVQDTGIGIAKQQQKRVFSRFFRGANAVRAETEGTGLGLFIAKNIVEAHGGKIWFESLENKGTTFYFTLPT